MKSTDTIVFRAPRCPQLREIVVQDGIEASAGPRLGR